MRSFKWIFRPHNLCTIVLYVIFLLCIFLNVYVLLSRDDTIYYLRLYHLLVGILMISAGVVMMEFFLRTRTVPKLESPHALPRPALIGAVVLTIGIVLGYLYFIVYNYAFSRCDKLVDALYGSELWLDAVYSMLMVSFCSMSLIYVLQRTYYGAVNSNLDRVGRLWINVTVAIVWIKVVVYKGYLSHQELCQRQELEGYWCPVMKRHYECDPVFDLKGTQKIWYYLDKGLLTSAVISCASEFFPVLLVAHWIACGGAEEKAEHMAAHKEAHLTFRTLMRRAMANVTRVYTEDGAPHHNVTPQLRLHNSTVRFFLAVAGLSTVLKFAAWLCSFYYTMDFDRLVKKHWQVGDGQRTFNDEFQLVANVVHLIMFVGLYLWERRIAGERLDQHHRAHSRGDVLILFGCCIVLSIKLVLQCVELEFQRADGYIYQSEAVVKSFNLVFVQIVQWLQYLTVRRLLGLSDQDIVATRKFMPWIGVAGVVTAWTHFGETFLETSLIKYQLTDENFKFSQTSLICMIFTQTIFPADYLYAFTASCCWLELLIRYLDIGFFQIGPPRLMALSAGGSHHHGGGGHHGKGAPLSSNHHSSPGESPRSSTTDSTAVSRH